METIKTYYRLTKPGIIYGNSLTLIGGFFLAAHGHFYGWTLLAVLIGSALMIASACVTNNVIDRGIDAKMQRTDKRATVTGEIQPVSALLYAGALGIIGISTLAVFTNLITVIVGLIGFVDYVVLYGYTKRRSIHGTLVGCISGATPIVAGYTAASGRFDLGAAILAAIMVMWQLPHFYAIAMFRLHDYKKAKLPVFPVVVGVTKSQTIIQIQIVCFMGLCLLLSLTGYAPFIFALIMVGGGLYWFYNTADKAAVSTWGKQSFLHSLVVILMFSFSLFVTSMFR